MSLGAPAGKLALITGASKGMSLIFATGNLSVEGRSFADHNPGIGKATAIRLTQDGASLLINYASD